MRPALLIATAFIAAAQPAASDPLVAGKALEQLLAPHVLEKTSRAHWEIIKDEMGVVGWINLPGTSWKLSASSSAMNQPAEGKNQLDHVILTTGDLSIAIKSLTLTSSNEMSTSVSDGHSIGSALLSGALESLDALCADVSTDIEAAAERVTFINQGRPVGQVDSVTATLQMAPHGGSCTLRMVLQASGVVLETGSDQRTDLRFISIVSQGPIEFPEQQATSITQFGAELVRQGDLVEIADLPTMLTGSFQTSLGAALHRVVGGDLTGIHDAMDIVAAFARPGL
jgi:hypothetical protein